MATVELLKFIKREAIGLKRIIEHRHDVEYCECPCSQCKDCYGISQYKEIRDQWGDLVCAQCAENREDGLEARLERLMLLLKDIPLDDGEIERTVNEKV